MSYQDNLNNANELGRTIAALMAQPMPRSTGITQSVDSLIGALAAKAHELLNPPAIKASSPGNEIVMGVGDTAHIHGNGDVELVSTGTITFKDPMPALNPTLQDFFEFNLARGTIDFSLRACRLPGGLVGFCLHPQLRSGETAQFIVNGNALTTHVEA